MGVLLSRVRKKKSAVETLEKLDHDIKEIEENRTNAQKKYKKITKLLLVYSVGLYILLGIIFYFQYKSTLRGKLLYLVPLAISPLLLYIIRHIISWYFVRLLNKNQTILNEMKKEKKRILDEVMDKETYKVAKQILEKFSDDSTSKLNYSCVRVPSIQEPRYQTKRSVTFYRTVLPMQLANTNQPNNVLRRRTITGPSVPRTQTPVKSLVRSQTGEPSLVGRPMSASPAPMLRLPAPILPLQRSYMDKVVEYLIGDGPNNRYALICSQCHSHNGMALKEEFEYIGFKCCYCFFYNPARKVKPEAPKLETSFKSKRESESDSEKTSGENSDAEQKSNPGENSPRLESSYKFDLSGTEIDIKSPIYLELLKSVDEKEKEATVTAEENETGDSKTSDSDQPEVPEVPESNIDCDESLEKS